ncbi:unnamed protein product [Heligmosomoides polygyrus]|uniref:Uncharacterized protein n=1 Tax=Heligmosomoides polygyrus TaxID=6339 RepID=A0A183GN74_HELPZ|nr:unnamed protein product [Heligmosomoides polygyrus]
MDRRLGADYYSFVSPIVDLREFLEEAHAAKQTMEGSPPTKEIKSSPPPESDIGYQRFPRRLKQWLVHDVMKYAFSSIHSKWAAGEELYEFTILAYTFSSKPFHHPSA